MCQGNCKRAVWESYSGELKVVEAAVSQDEPSPLPRLNPTSWNTEEEKEKKKSLYAQVLAVLSVETDKLLKYV